MANFSFEVVGQTAESRPVTITVQNPPAPTPYEAGGFMACEVNLESALSLAMRARTRRLTHEDQVSRYPDDEGFLHADGLEGREFVFFTKEKQKRG